MPVMLSKGFCFSFFFLFGKSVGLGPPFWLRLVTLDLETWSGCPVLDAFFLAPKWLAAAALDPLGGATPFTKRSDGLTYCCWS